MAEVQMSLSGLKRTSLDDKGRVLLPANYRKKFGDQSIKLVPVKGALYGFSIEEYDAWIAYNFPEANLRNTADEEISLKFAAHTVEVDIDKAGRICVGRVPESDLRALGISSGVVLIGHGRRFEIWDEEKYDRLHPNGDAGDADLFG